MQKTSPTLSEEIHLRLPAELLARLDLAAVQSCPLEDRVRPSRSALIRRAIVLGLQKLEKPRKRGAR